jgi:hypothetical protein
MLAAAATRGCRVFVIAPSAANNPNPEPPVVLLEHDALTELMAMRDRLAPQLTRSGGEIRLGLYTARAPINDVTARTKEIVDGLQRAPWIKELIPFDPAALSLVFRATANTEANPASATTIARDETPRAPQLHQKTQLIARPGAIGALVRQPGWERVLAQAMQSQAQETAELTDQLGWTAPSVDSAAVRRTDALLRGLEQSLPESERRAVSFYFSLGSQNQDQRGLALDGEATLIVSGFHAAAGLADLYFVMARSTWIATSADLDRMLPPPTSRLAKLARRVRGAF